MAKSISAALRQLLQKGGDKLAERSASREQFVKWADELAKMGRSNANRGWGDQVKDMPKKGK